MRWLFDVGEEQERIIVEGVQESGTSSATYYVLLILSTIIASFGLIANSTATVIGAMIVAPLMGPIVGLGLGLVRGDTIMARRALFAEVAGVAMVLATSAAIALLVGIENVDFSASEIVGRTRPTLYDLAIGFAAGLAGAYCTVNPKISSSIAGVAIAVALVPPLSVSGLALAGSLHHGHLAHEAFEAFMLFLANFLTIELAAVLLFLASGLGHFERLMRERSLSTALLVNLVALVGTAAFLYTQLNTLVLERNLKEATRDYLSSRIPALIPGASVADLTVTLNPRALKVNVAARASQEITPSMVAEMARDLRSRLGLKASVSLDLVIGTGLFTYVSPAGRLYVQEAEPDPAQVLNQRVDQALRGALEVYPRAEMVGWQRQDAAIPGQVVVTIRSPYVFDAWLVGELQRLVNERLQKLDPAAPRLTLTVRTTLGQDYTAAGSVQTSVSDLRSAQEQERLGLEQQVRGLMARLVSEEPRSRLLSVVVLVRTLEAAPSPDASGSPAPSPEASGSPSASPEASPEDGPIVAPTPVMMGRPSLLEVTASVRSPRLLKGKRVAEWQDDLQEELGLPVRLSVENLLGEVLTPLEEETRPAGAVPAFPALPEGSPRTGPSPSPSAGPGGTEGTPARPGKPGRTDASPARSDP